MWVAYMLVLLCPRPLMLHAWHGNGSRGMSRQGINEHVQWAALLGYMHPRSLQLGSLEPGFSCFVDHGCWRSSAE